MLSTRARRSTLTKRHEVIHIQFRGVRDDPAGVGADPEAGIDLALRIEGDRDLAVPDQDFLTGILLIAVDVDPVWVIISVVSKSKIQR